MTYCEDAPCCGCCGTNLYGVRQDSLYTEPDQDDFYDQDYDEDVCDPYNSYCANDDDDCEECAAYWLGFHADGMAEDAAMEFGLFGSET